MQSPLLWDMDSAFAAANDWVDSDIYCDEDGDGDYEIEHDEEGCGCNALVSVPAYEEASADFHTALEQATGLIDGIRCIVQGLDSERSRVYIKDENVRADYGVILARIARLIGPDAYDVRRAAEGDDE